MRVKGNKKYGAAVRKARVASGLSQRALATKLSRTQACVCNIETGNASPGPELRAAIAKLLGVS